jgi:periplasmic divalent cation tolerance protein
MEYVAIYITAANREEGEKIARKIIEEKLVACVNIVPEVESTYWWQKKIEVKTEVFLMAKTILPKVDQLVARVKSFILTRFPRLLPSPLLPAIPIISNGLRIQLNNPPQLAWGT